MCAAAMPTIRLSKEGTFCQQYLLFVIILVITTLGYSLKCLTTWDAHVEISNLTAKIVYVCLIYIYLMSVGVYKEKK